jgi:hypothetical protein
MVLISEPKPTFCQAFGEFTGWSPLPENVAASKIAEGPKDQLLLDGSNVNEETITLQWKA